MSTVFEPGAPAPEGHIPLCVPEIRGNEWKYIKECLDSKWVSSAGSFVVRFEQMVADYVGSEYAVATVNGTAALHTALLVAGVEPGDEVLVSTLTFIAPANAIRYCGAWPVFIDAEPDYWQMDPERVIDFLEEECQWRSDALYNKATGRRVKAILPVDILGHPVDVDPILEVARKYQLVVIEDAAESLGAIYKQRRVGRLGDLSCLSFNGNKIVTTGGGGMILTDNKEWADRAKHLTTQAKSDPAEYIHNEIGYNYRLSNIQAAMGCAQLESIEDFIDRKRLIAQSYEDVLCKVEGIEVPRQAPWSESIYWLYTILVNGSEFGLESRSLIERMQNHQVQARPLWTPQHINPAHSVCQFVGSGIAESLHSRAISLPSSVGLEDAQVEYICSLISSAASD